jgi:hypothetical protein
MTSPILLNNKYITISIYYVESKRQINKKTTSPFN